MLRMAALSATALALSACAGMVQTGYGDITPFYDRSVVTHASSGGAFPLVVHGNPFPGLSQPQAAQAIARDMRLPGWFPQVPFAPAPVASAPRGDYRLVLVFNAAAPVSSADACGDLRQVPVAPQPNGATTLRAAFCTRGEMISDTTARMAAAQPGSPAFRQMLDQVSMTIFPERNRDRDPDPSDNLVLGRRGFLPRG
jgi:hypothetical protein